MELRSLEDAVFAIRDMVVRGAPLIGAAASWGMYLAVREGRESLWKAELERAANELLATRPTAVNLEYAIKRCQESGPCLKDKKK